MDAFRRTIAGHTVIGLDASVFIYHLEAHPRYSPLTRLLLEHIQEGRSTGVTSTITLMELTVQPWRLQKPAVAREYEALLVHFPNLRLVDITRGIARSAAQLRARYNVYTADALQAAAALTRGATLFVTNDAKLRRLDELLNILVLDDWIH